MVFSTELKGVLGHPGVPRELNHRSLSLYLSVNHIPSPFTLAKGVRKMLPSECLSFLPDQRKSHRYWRPDLEPGPHEFDHWLTRTHSEMVDSVKRTVGDAERVAVYLSGGVDSSAVLAALAESDVTDVQAFTLAYRGNETTYDLPWAEQVATATGSQHHILTIDSETDATPELMSTLLSQIDEPYFAASRVLKEYFLGQASCTAGFNSILTGSTHNFNLQRFRALKEADSSFGARTMEETLRAGFLVNSGTRASLIDRMDQILVQPPDMTIIQEAVLANREVLEDFDQVRILQLDKALRSALGFNNLFSQHIPPLYGFEERTPFLDTQMAQFIFSVPPIFRGIESKEFDKALLRESFRDILKSDFSQRMQEDIPVRLRHLG